MVKNEIIEAIEKGSPITFSATAAGLIRPFASCKRIEEVLGTSAGKTGLLSGRVRHPPTQSKS